MAFRDRLLPTHVRTESGIKEELWRAPLEVRQIVDQLAKPITDMHHRVERLPHIKRALMLVDPRRARQLWGKMQDDFGNSLQQLSLGDRAENLERAIAAYNAALEVRTRTNFPIRWARIHIGLANAYANRVRGDRAENLERAISAYSAALKVYTRADFPVRWAMTQKNPGAAFSDRVRGDRAEKCRTCHSRSMRRPGSVYAGRFSEGVGWTRTRLTQVSPFS